MTTGAWENRIVGSGEEDPQTLIANERNWRTHPPDQRPGPRRRARSRRLGPIHSGE